MPTLQNLTRAIFGACLALVHAVALAQGAAGYPGRMIKLVVPFPAGGATDIMARNIAQKLNEAWKQPVVVENRPGANGTIGADAVAKSPADGYTYLVATIAHSANVTLFPNTPYQLQRDLQAVAILGLAVTTDKRYSLLPDIPTTSESGIPGLEVTSWNGLMAPTGTPGDIVTKLNAEVVRITGMPDMNARITELGYQTSAMSVGDADKYIKADIELWRKVIRAANIRAD